LNSLIGTEVLWVRSSTNQRLCIVSGVELGRRVSEINISDADSGDSVLSILVSRVDNNHPERKLLEEFVIVSNVSRRPIPASKIVSLRATIWDCISKGMARFEVNDLGFNSLTNEVNRINSLGDM